MKEFVFLPDRKTEKSESFRALAQIMTGTARLSVAARPESVAETRFSVQAQASAARSVEASATAVDEAAPYIEMIDYVQQTGVVLLRSNQVLTEHDFAEGQIVPIHLYRPAIADVGVGRSKLKLQSGPQATDFLKIRLA